MSKTSIIPSKGTTGGQGIAGADPSGFLQLRNCKVDANGVITSRDGFGKISSNIYGTAFYDIYGGGTFNSLPFVAAVTSAAKTTVRIDCTKDALLSSAYASQFSRRYGQFSWGSHIPTSGRRMSIIDAGKCAIANTPFGTVRLPKLTSDRQASEFGGYFDHAHAALGQFAGTPRCLDPYDNTIQNVTNYNWLDGQRSVAYRVVLLYRDHTDQLYTGAPSGRLLIQNTNAVTTSRCPRIGIPLRREITTTNRTKWLVQVYRTYSSKAGPDGVIPDPGDDMYLVAEFNPTSAEVTARVCSYIDLTPDGLLGPPLYTNASQEGPLAGRDEPPIAKDIAFWKDSVWYANARQKNRLIFNILGCVPNGSVGGVANARGLDVGDVIMVGGLAMRAVDQIANEVNPCDFATFKTTITDPVLHAIRATERLVYRYNTYVNTASASSGRFPCYLFNIGGPDDAYGKVMAEEIEIGDESGLWLGVSRSDSPTAYLPDPSYGLLTAVTDVATAANYDIVITIGAHTYVANDVIYFGYLNRHHNTGNTKVRPGAYVIKSVGATTVTVEEFQYDYSGTGASYWCVASQVDAAITGYIHKIGTTAGSTYSKSNAGFWSDISEETLFKKNRIFYSVPGEPDGVPILNYLDVGDASFGITAIAPLGESLFVFKRGEGCFVISGEYGAWSVDMFDDTVRIHVTNSVATLNNKIFLMAERGFTEVTSNGARVLIAQGDTRIKDLVSSASLVYYHTAGVLHKDSAYMMTNGFVYFDDTKTTSTYTFRNNLSFDISGDNPNSFIPRVICSTRYNDYSMTQLFGYVTHLTAPDARQIAVLQNNGSSALGAGYPIPQHHSTVIGEKFFDTAIDLSSLVDAGFGASSLYFDFLRGTVTLTGLEAGDTIQFKGIGVDNLILRVDSVTDTGVYDRVAFGSNLPSDASTALLAITSLGPSPTIIIARKHIDCVISTGHISPEGEDTHSEFTEIGFIAGSRAAFRVVDVVCLTDMTAMSLAGSDGSVTNNYVYGYWYGDYGNALSSTKYLAPPTETDPIEIGTTKQFRAIVPRNARNGNYIVVRMSHQVCCDLLDIRGIYAKYVETGDNDLYRNRNA